MQQLTASLPSPSLPRYPRSHPHSVRLRCSCREPRRTSPHRGFAHGGFSATGRAIVGRAAGASGHVLQFPFNADAVALTDS